MDWQGMMDKYGEMISKAIADRRAGNGSQQPFDEMPPDEDKNPNDADDKKKKDGSGMDSGAILDAISSFIGS